ncbi:MAG: peptide deformylase [Gemmatimonadetes bacterium]|nr:peptide deformylase [Gemmatimonadota bacterium]
MRDLPIELLGSPFLRRVAVDVETFDEALRDLVTAMFRTMYRAGGQGLAAPQVAVSQRIVVIDMPDEDSPALTLINPRIIERGRALARFEEGCLSIPGVTAAVERHTQVVVEALRWGRRSPQARGRSPMSPARTRSSAGVRIDHPPLKRQLLMRQYRKLDAQRQA